MLDTLTNEDFKPALNDTFETSLDGTPVGLKLASVNVMDERYSAPEARLSFSLTFTGPPEPLLPQGTYQLRHETLGNLDLFTVPIGLNEDGYQYEVIFN